MCLVRYIVLYWSTTPGRSLTTRISAVIFVPFIMLTEKSGKFDAQSNFCIKVTLPSVLVFVCKNIVLIRLCNLDLVNVGYIRG